MIKKIRLILFLKFIFTLYINSNSIDQTTDKKILNLKLTDAINLALRNNLQIETEQLKLEQKKWAIYTCWNTFIPSMSFSTAFTRLNNQDPIKVNSQTIYIGVDDPLTQNPVIPNSYDSVMKITTPETEIKKPEWNIGFNFDLTFALNASMGFAIYNTILDYKAGKISAEIAQKKIIRDIKKNYFSLVLLKENIKLLENNIEIAKKRYEQTIISYKNGLVPEFNILSSQVAYENLKPALQDLNNNYNIAILAFKQTLGLKSDVEIVFTDNLEISELKEFDYNEIIKKYRDNRLDIQSINNNINSLINLRNIYIASLTPTFLLKFSADPSFQYDLTKYDDWKDKDINELWKQRGGMLMFAFSFPLDYWFPFSKKQMDIINTNYNIKNMVLGLNQLKNQVELEIKTIVMNLNKSIKKMEILLLNIKLAQKAYSMAEEAYKYGTKDLLDVQNQQLELDKANINLLQEKYNYISSLFDLEYSTNNNFYK